MEKWLIPCNLNNYDILGAFKKYDEIEWKQSTNIQVGDIVYIYVSSPYSSIKYETKAIEVDIPEAKNQDDEFQIDTAPYADYGRYMNLKLLRTLGDDAIPLKALKTYGIKTVQGPRKITDEMHSFILEQTSKVNELEQRYFFVFQNKSFAEEYEGGYLWAPQETESGRQCSHWNRMKEVRKGDLVIHSNKKRIEAISVPKVDVYEADRPDELPDQWDQRGWRVDTDYFTIKKPIITSDHMDQLMAMQPDQNAPFNSIGRGNTGYLFAANREMAEYIIRESIKNQDAEDDRDILQSLLDGHQEEIVFDEEDQTYVEGVEKTLANLSEEPEPYSPEPKQLPESSEQARGTQYKRDSNRAANALRRATYQCELGDDHPSFISRRTGKNYTEPHHLIPLSKQRGFDYSLDVEANIVSLCSNCHNEMHYGQDAVERITALYETRQDELAQAGIPIRLADLLNLY